MTRPQRPPTSTSGTRPTARRRATAASARPSATRRGGDRASERDATPRDRARDRRGDDPRHDPRRRRRPREATRARPCAPASATASAASTGAPTSSAGSPRSASRRSSPAARRRGHRDRPVGDRRRAHAATAEQIGLGGGILLLAVLAIAWFCGGYVAGRMARFDGARQGSASGCGRSCRQVAMPPRSAAASTTSSSSSTCRASGRRQHAHHRRRDRAGAPRSSPRCCSRCGRQGRRALPPPRRPLRTRKCVEHRELALTA